MQIADTCRTPQAGYVESDWKKIPPKVQPATPPVAPAPPNQPKAGPNAPAKAKPKEPLDANPWGGMAISPEVVGKLSVDDFLDLSKSSVGPCLNCRRVIESRGIGGDKLSFYNGKEKPFGLTWDAVKAKVV